MVLLAVQTYSPASVYWMLFRVRDDTRAWLRTTMCPSRVCQEGREGVRAQGRAWGGGGGAGQETGPPFVWDQSHILSPNCASA